MNDDTMDLTPMADIVGEMAAPEIAKYLSKADAQDPGCVWNAKPNLATQRTLLLGQRMGSVRDLYLQPQFLFQLRLSFCLSVLDLSTGSEWFRQRRCVWNLECKAKSCDSEGTTSGPHASRLGLVNDGSCDLASSGCRLY